MGLYSPLPMLVPFVAQSNPYFTLQVMKGCQEHSYHMYVCWCCFGRLLRVEWTIYSGQCSWGCSWCCIKCCLSCFSIWALSVLLTCSSCLQPEALCRVSFWRWSPLGRWWRGQEKWLGAQCGAAAAPGGVGRHSGGNQRGCEKCYGNNAGTMAMFRPYTRQ